MKHTFERYCKNYQSIENYEKAKKDNFKGWHCHHRLETHTSDGERRLVDITQKELKALNMYYHRPPEELIFLPRSEHEAFRKGKPRSAETRNKLSAANKGNTYAKGKPAWNKGKKMSEEYCRKCSESQKGKQAGEKHPMYGKHFTEESKKKMSDAKKGKHWYNNGKINVMTKECPEGFVPGRLH